MSTNFCKRLISTVICLTVACICIYAFSISRAQTVEIGKYFYFLVSDDERVEVGAEFAKLNGGAGYLISYGNSEYVALSVYLDRAEGENVQDILACNGEKTYLLTQGTQTLYFKGKQKKKSDFYINALRTLESYMSVLNDCISRLEKGMTQEKCKRILTLLKKQFAFSSSTYAEYPSYAVICGKSAQELNNICASTVFLKDLRYLLCWQVEKYVQLCAEFSL